MLLFLILQNDDKEGRISANGESGCTIRNYVGEFCTLVREPWVYWSTAMTTDFSNMSDFRKRSLHIFYRSLNVTISWQTQDKIQIT